MAENSNIEWTTHTFNPWRGCTKVSAGCANCYAEAMSKRNPGVLGVWGDDGTRVLAADSYWKQPYKWHRDAEGAEERHRVFCASLADVFEDREDVMLARERLMILIENTPSLDWLLLTKRPQNVMRLVFREWTHNFPSNVWLGTSIENQEAADERIPELVKCPAGNRFLSMEPLLGEVDVRQYLYSDYDKAAHDRQFFTPLEGFTHAKVLWVVVGGESGPNARPMHPDWARSICDQCSEAGVPFFFKQWGEHSQDMVRVGKRDAGRELDGKTWDEIPGLEPADTIRVSKVENENNEGENSA
tara:strand:+ start:423 stop:1325 length:903 start_codon:yes stop_codon:yes gene_type:complete